MVNAICNFLSKPKQISVINMGIICCILIWLCILLYKARLRYDSAFLWQQKTWLYFEIKKKIGMYWREELSLILQVLISAAPEKEVAVVQTEQRWQVIKLNLINTFCIL